MLDYYDTYVFAEDAKKGGGTREPVQVMDCEIRDEDWLESGAQVINFRLNIDLFRSTDQILH